ncbi:alpha-xenorhabdolysin family binary toxin subunit B [Pseudomonas lijiangensis]|uniref:Alpha-xenorhabdolysin family binary toxin subunit B n=1 Tax=Pseudomonas lijiangensis TaxID=2995658 RepID=A0ABX8HU21_9PSED|nr:MULTISPECIES: alpha-xenorhabdolysin family binary toxin subunit B [Pseudomonas syringae group]MBX8492377.1 alpha-xenorhabdolysin family binary toxin subunit B [Pseudomonas cichorii]MBX8502922.1 alpha-xenorhabdolysin family binary toxin subunit B [Pseudomonas lijiangensis]MBX8507864.1 alpha-xenorhabdolysin family binary toxin subunit B [Pseudomonas lijiangensis]MBX8522517.1 alpha-xenorhabdolysin family binary toxin subunit B [Pseudomonas cichorii]MBX8552033.1 alpha-xenorhabdolysin family bin
MNNTISAIDTPLNIKTPDLQAMSNSQNALSSKLVTADILYSKTAYLPNIYQRFKRINNAVIIERQRLGGACMKLRIDIESRIAQLRKYDQELAETKDQDDLNDIQEERVYTLKNATATASAEAVKLANALNEMKEAFSRQQTQEFQTSLEQDVLKATTGINETNTLLASLQEERRVLTEAIDAIESKGFASIAKDTLLTAEKVIALGVQPPQIAVITLAIEQMKATLEYGAEGINFIAMTKRRDSMRERIDKLFEKVNQKEKEKLALTQRIELIACFHAMDDQRTLYVEQYQKIAQTLDSFLAINQAVALDEKEFSRRFINTGLQLASYLQPIR